MLRWFLPRGLTLDGRRQDRILNEAFETADPLELMRLFGITEQTAMRYVAGRPALADGVGSTEPQSNSHNPPGRLAPGFAAAVAVTYAAVAGGTGLLASLIEAPRRSSSGVRIEIDADRASSCRPPGTARRGVRRP
jgi:hypothetical protein